MPDMTLLWSAFSWPLLSTLAVVAVVALIANVAEKSRRKK